MQPVDHLHEVLGPAVAGGRREVPRRLIAPRAVEGVLRHRQQLDVGETVRQHVIGQRVCELGVGGETCPRYRYSAERPEVHLVDRHRAAGLTGAVGHPRRVSPRVVECADHRCRRGWLVRRRPDGVRLLHALAVVAGDGISVGVADERPGNVARPDAGTPDQLHLLTRPAVEVAEDVDGPGGRRPHGEPRAGGVGMGAEAVVQVPVGALVEQEQVHLADGIGTVDLRPHLAVAEDRQAAADIGVGEDVRCRPAQPAAPRRRQDLARHVVRRGLADEVVEVGDDEVGVAASEALEGGVEHGRGAVADGTTDGVGDEPAVVVHAARGVAVEGGGESRHVVRADAGDGVGGHRREGAAVVQVELLLEHADDVPPLERLGDLCRDRAQVLADDRRRRALGLGGDDGEQFLPGIADVHAIGRAAPVGDPPQPLHAHDVVDAQHGGVLAGAGDEVAPQGVSAAPAGARQLRREAPVLAFGEELVRWGADVHPGGEQRAVGPRLVPVGVAADRQVEGEGGAALTLDGGELAIGEVLGEHMAALDERPRATGVGRVARTGAPAGEVGDVGTAGDEAFHAGLHVRIEVGHRVEQLPAAAAGELGPVDERAERRHRGGRDGCIVEVDLVPVQPARRRVRARVERLVEHCRVDRKRGHDGEPDAMCRSRQRGEVGEGGQWCGLLPERVRRDEQSGPAVQLGRARHRRRGDDERRGLAVVEHDLVAADRQVRRGADRRAVGEHDLGAFGQLRGGRPGDDDWRQASRRGRLGVGFEHLDDDAQGVLGGVVVPAGDVPVVGLDAELDGAVP